MKELAVVVPTRGRPGNATELVTSWAFTGARAELIFRVDEDDPELEAYVKVLSAEPVTLAVGPRGGMVAALNEQAMEAAPHYYAVGFMGDDHRPRTPGWDARFLETLSGGGPGFVYGNDLLQGELMPTAVAMTSDVVLALGYMVPPALYHLNADLVWRDWGRGIGRITYLDDVVVEHMHPAAGKAQHDDGYARANRAEQVLQDGDAYARYLDENLEDDLDRLRRML